MDEVWLDVHGYEERYQVSNIGRIRSKDIILNRSDGKREFRKGRIIKLQINQQGYPVYFFSHSLSSKRKLISIHRIVAQAFIPNPDNKPCIDHINRNRADNRVENLRWCTLKENMNNPNTLAHLKVCRPNYKHTAETRAKLSELQKGKVLKDSTKIKLRERAIPVSQYSKDGHLITHHKSALYASESLNIPPTHIRECCRGIRKSAGGFRWIYTSEYVEGLVLPKITYNRPKGLKYKRHGKFK